MSHWHGDQDPYATAEKMWSGRPNQALLAEAPAVPSGGKALDVGCGEGADAVWLAQQGWAVTAIDLWASGIARGRTAAADAGVDVEWLVGPFEDARLTGFDFVTTCYPAFTRNPEASAEQALLAAVRPGGTLLVVHHAEVDAERARLHDHDPDAVVTIDQVRDAAVAAGWRVDTDDLRERDLPTGAGAHHRIDRIVRLSRPPV